LLQGGIVGRIAKEYLSIDGVLAGPSLEVAAHRVGYLGSSGDAGLLYCDDELTENEIAGRIPYIRVSLFFNIQCSLPDISLQATGFKKVNGHGFQSLPLGHHRTGLRSLEWTERCDA
jgi:hypothetical protein